MLEFWLKGSKHRLYFINEGSHDTPRDLAERICATGPLAARLRNVVRLADRPENPESWKKLLAVIKRALKHGIEITSKNPARCKCFSIDDLAEGASGKIEVCEFKADDLRMMFFREEPIPQEPCTTLIITHCFSKKRDDTPPEELQRFCDLRQRYYERRVEAGASDAVHFEEILKHH